MEQFGNVLSALLPDSDVGKILFLLIFGFFVLVVTGRFKLEWIGAWWQRYAIPPYRRRFYCRRNKHSWRRASVMGYLGSSGGIEAVWQCRHCGKQDHFEATM